MSNEVATIEAVSTFLGTDDIKAQIAKALPALCTPERFMRIAITAITKTPKLASCTQESLISCLLDLAQLGIEADGRRAHLIPYGTTCTLILDYKGIVELVKRSGEVVTIHADKVCEKDTFKVNMGVLVEHIIDYTKPRGAAYAYYAYAKMKDGSMQTQVMTKEEVEVIRQSSRGKNSTPWTQHFDQMANKTVFRRLSKWLPMSPEIAQKMDDVEKIEFDFEMPKPKEPKTPGIPLVKILKAMKEAPDKATLDEKWQKAQTTEHKNSKEVEAAYQARAQELNK